MFYSDVILSKRGPLARVWLAAHWERKITKTQFLQTNIEKSVDAIVAEKTMPMALRLSGQLLLGVVRIYSRKARYLLDDCNEALLKIKMAFRSGTTNVDLSANQLTASKSAITMAETRTEFDLLLPDPFLQNWDLDMEPAGAGGADDAGRRERDGTPASSAAGGGGASGRGTHTAKESDITLPRNDFGLYDDDYGMGGAGYDFLVDGINSADFDPDGGFDLGLDLDDGGEPAAPRGARAPGGQHQQQQRRDSQGRLVDADGVPLEGSLADFLDDSLSIGVGRDAAPLAERSLGSLLGFGSERGAGQGDAASAAGDPQGQGVPADWNDELPPLQDDYPDYNDELPPLDVEPIHSLGAGMSMGQRLARSVTPATQVGDDTMALLQNVTPNTLGKMKAAAAKRMALAAAKLGAGNAGAGAGSKKRPLVDAVIEIQQSAGSKSQSLTQSAAHNKRPDSIVKPGALLPEDPEALRMLQIERDPIAYYLPELALPKNQTTVCLGPSDLAPELRSLFTFDLAALRRKQAERDAAYAPPAKRRRTDVTDEDLLSEVGRRDDGSVRRDSLGLGGIGDDTTMTKGGPEGFNDWNDELPPLQDDYPDDMNDELPPLDDHPMLPGQQPAGSDSGDAADGEADQTALRRSARGKGGPTDVMAQMGQLPALSRLSTPALDDADAEAYASHPLGAFEGGQHDSQYRASAPSQPVSQNSTAGWSRNTVRALNVVRDQLTEMEGVSGSAGQEEKVLSFEKVSEKSSRRAAAAFFFEMLALGTKDCVKLKQDEPYGDIEIRGKSKLWDIEVVAMPTQPTQPSQPAGTMHTATQRTAHTTTAAAVTARQSPSVRSTPRGKQARAPSVAAAAAGAAAAAARAATPARSIRSETPRATPAPA